MKIIFTLLTLAILVSAGVMIFLLKKGVALRTAGVIAPTEFTLKPELIGKSIAGRLFPDFQTAKNVIWYIEPEEEPFVSVPEIALRYYQTTSKPELIDLRKTDLVKCDENCWYVQSAQRPLSDDILKKVKTQPSIEIYIQYFDRNGAVTEVCENEKILELKCIGPVSAREVRRKLKTSAPHFFMRRYLDSQFYLFVEKI